MSWQKNYLAFGLLGILLLSATADNSVHILSKYGQLITSSTLNWLPQAHYDPSKEIVAGGFEIIQETEEDNQAEKPQHNTRPLYVCRALHIGVLVFGSQKHGEKRCTVSIHGNVHSYEKYELLENVDGAARLTWAHWDKYMQPPVGAIATDEMFIARHQVQSDKEHSDAVQRYTHYIGTYYSNDNLGTIIYVNDNGIEGSAKSGDVLVETEPIYYELTSVKLNWPKKRVIKYETRELGSTTIRNADSKPGKMAEAFGYFYNYSIYWGQGHAILKGLNTSITLYNGTALPNIIWGIEEKENRSDIYTVEVFLQPGTAVNVTLKGNYTDMEIPYTGTLVSHYEDRQTKLRMISGIRREETMFDIIPEFKPVYFLNNHSLVPTTTPIPTTEPSTTTMLPQDVSKETRQRDMDKIDHDENMIIPPKKSDMSNMQSDDGGPLSLKNKVEDGHSGTDIFKSNFIFVSLLVIAIYRIT